MKMIECMHLSKTYKLKMPNSKGIKQIFFPNYRYVEAIKDISFTVDTGEIVGVLGSNGAGKSTLIKMLTGVLSSTTGNIKVAGYCPEKREDAFKKSIGLMMGNRNSLIYDLPVEDSYTYLKTIYNVKEEYYHNLTYLLEKINVQHLLKIPVRKLSLGQRKKVELVSILIHNPKIIFLDEATIGMDVQSKIEILKFIKYLQNEYNTTIIYTSHDLNDVEKICDKIIFLDEGKLVFDGKINDFGMKNDQMKVEVIFNEIVNIRHQLTRSNREQVNEYTYRFFVHKGEMNDFLTTINEYSIQEISIQKVTLEDKVLNYVEIHSNGD